MRRKLLYIELKSGHGDRGPAWIGFARLSKTGRTVYFNGRALRRYNAIRGNHSCVESGDEYWVSGVKLDGSDRHWAGGGVVMVEARALPEYLRVRGLTELDPASYRIVSDVQETDIEKFRQLENQPYNTPVQTDRASRGG